MVSKNIFQIIQDNQNKDEILASDGEILEAIAQDYRDNRRHWRVATTGADYVRWVRLSGGAGMVSVNSHRELNEGVPMATFLISREAFPAFYCDHIMQEQGCRGSLKRIQAFQLEFDQKKDETVKSVPFTPEYSVVCLSEELGEFARCIKKQRRAEANDLLEKADEWRDKSKDEATDMLIYLVKVFNSNGWDMADAYYEKMTRNHVELDNGGGKFLGTAETEVR